MDLCVGAVSKRVVEEAARIGVPQIVASRRQVNGDGGYIGLDQRSLVETVKSISDGRTLVVRDHGGPHQNGESDDDWHAELKVDAEAGFDILHLDVSKLQQDKQLDELLRLATWASDVEVDFEVGGERDEQEWIDTLLQHVVDHKLIPMYTIVQTGGHIWADRQRGRTHRVRVVNRVTEHYHELGTLSKAHNQDWLGARKSFDGALDAYNIAPEYGVVEVDALMRVWDRKECATAIAAGLESDKWRRWFKHGEGTTYEKARCALRYILPRVEDMIGVDDEQDEYVRGEIRDALRAG